MTDARWVEVEDDIRAACRHIRMAARLYDAGGFGDPEVEDEDLPEEDLDAYRARMALQHAMQSAHTSLEGGLKRILEILGEEVPSGQHSHADLVKRVSRPLALPGLERDAILAPEIVRDVNESRRFRHRAMHDYDNFEPDRATLSIDAARRLHAALLPCIEAFRNSVDPPEEESSDKA
jgi:hypothetical protein